MEKIAWSDKYAVGFDEIDEQHKHLIELINSLIEHPHLATDAAGFEDFVEKLLDFTRFHFLSEERVLRDMHYPDFEAHQADHRHFIETTTEQCIDAIQMHHDNSEAILKTLYDMWSGHIQEEIVELRTFFSNTEAVS